jgi:hypothetical protein
VAVQAAAKAQSDLAQEALLTLLREQGVERPAIEALSVNTLWLTLPDTRRMSDVLGLLRHRLMQRDTR